MARSKHPGLRRLFLVLALAFILGVLGFFKYYGFFAVSLHQLCGSLNIPCSLPLLDIVLPVGISFFTFQALSYIIDVYRRAMDPARRLLDFAIYLSFFHNSWPVRLCAPVSFSPRLRIPNAACRWISAALPA